jgi:hypothetical protein
VLWPTVIDQKKFSKAQTEATIPEYAVLASENSVEASIIGLLVVVTLHRHLPTTWIIVCFLPFFGIVMPASNASVVSRVLATRTAKSTNYRNQEPRVACR